MSQTATNHNRDDSADSSNSHAAVYNQGPQPTEHSPQSSSAQIRNSTADSEAELETEIDTDTLLDATGSLIVVFTRQGRIKRFNRACEIMTGYKETDVIGRFVWEILGVDEEKQAIKGIFNQLLQGQLQSYYESTWIGKAGESHVVAWSSTVLTNLLGRVDFIIASGIEVTEQRRSRRQLEGQYRQSHLLAEITQKVRQSLELEKILQTTVNEVIELLGCDRVFILHTPIPQEVILAAEALSASHADSSSSGVDSLRSSTVAKARLIQPDYINYYKEQSISVIDMRGGPGVAPFLDSVLTDLSVQSELAVPILIQSPQHDFLPQTDPENKESFWGLLVAHQCETARRWSPLEIDLMQQLANQIGVAICHAELTDQLESVVEKRTAQLTAINQQLRREMDERLRTETALRRSENQLRLITNALPALVAYIDHHHRFRFNNFAFQSWYGIPYRRIKGRQVSDIVTLENYQQMLPYLERALMGEAVAQETELLTSEGDRIWVSISYIPDDKDGQIQGVITLINDISDHKAADRMKDEFISMVSHELRTPLTSVHGALKLLNTGKLGSLTPDGQSLIDIAVNNTERLTRLINDVLDLERMDSGKMRLNLTCCDVSELIANAVEVMRPMADDHGIELVIRPADPTNRPALQVEADLDQAMQTLTNLLSNAIKFSPTDKTVWIGARLVKPTSHQTHEQTSSQTSSPNNSATVEFWVQDQGSGIPSESLETIFERFQRVDTSDGRKPGGTGLGLAICREIVQNHGGRIWVNSVHGQGSTFFFTLPQYSASAVDAIAPS